MISDNRIRLFPIIGFRHIPAIGTSRIRRDPIGMNNQVSSLSPSTSIDFCSSRVVGHMTRQHQLANQVSPSSSGISVAFCSSPVDDHLTRQQQLTNPVSSLSPSTSIDF